MSSLAGRCQWVPVASKQLAVSARPLAAQPCIARSLGGRQSQFLAAVPSRGCASRRSLHVLASYAGNGYGPAGKPEEWQPVLSED